MSLTLVMTTVARVLPASLRRRLIWSTSPARPRRLMSTAPMSSSRRRRANCFSFHGAESDAEGAGERAFARRLSSVRNAICGSILAASPPSVAGEVLDQAGPGDRRVRVEQVLTRLAQRDRVARARRRALAVRPQLAACLAAGDGRQGPWRGAGRSARRGPGLPAGAVARHGDQSTASLRSRRLGDELGLPAGRYQLRGQARRGLDADRWHLARQRGAPVERRL